MLKQLLITISLCLALVGCAGISSDLTSTNDPAFQPGPETSFAFMPEQDMRIQKRMLYDRSVKYLSDIGMKITTPEKADFLIALHITSQIETSVSIEMPALRGSMLPNQIDSTQKVDGASTFCFKVYRRSELENGNKVSLWEATVTARQVDFQKQEAEFIKAIFRQLGKSYQGKIRFNGQSPAANRT